MQLMSRDFSQKQPTVKTLSVKKPKQTNKPKHPPHSLDVTLVRVTFRFTSSRATALKDGGLDVKVRFSPRIDNYSFTPPSNEECSNMLQFEDENM